MNFQPFEIQIILASFFKPPFVMTQVNPLKLMR
jgi:hypothetical protein